MASTGRSAFSQDGQYYAFCGNDGKLKIWETASGRLKHEYTPNRHLSSPCSVIGWISVSPQSAGNVSVNASYVFQLPLPPFFSFPSSSLFMCLSFTIRYWSLDRFHSTSSPMFALSVCPICFLQSMRNFRKSYVKRISYLVFSSRWISSYTQSRLEDPTCSLREN